MKKTTRFLLICASLALFALPAFANGVFARANQTPEPCSAEGKAALYAEIYKDLKEDQAKAYELAKKYVACPTDAADAAESARITYLKGFITKFEKQDRLNQWLKLMGDKKYAEAFPIGKEILNDQPENPGVIIDLVFAGSAANNASFDADTVTFAKKAIQLLESGKAPEKWERFQSKDDALAWSNYIIATRAKSAPAETIPYFIKAASYESSVKKLPITYFSLGNAYYLGPYTKQSDAYQAKYAGKDETPESKLALENIYQVVDRIVDAYARAIALSGSDPQNSEIKTKAMASATDLYKFRHKDTVVGLDELIAGILSKPLPPEPIPLTVLPASAATPTPTPGSGTPATTGSNTPAPVKPTTPPNTTRATSPTRP